LRWQLEIALGKLPVENNTYEMKQQKNMNNH
jgi:hypothetical protein